MANQTKIEKASDRELVVTRTFNAPPAIVFEAWTTPELFKLWWVPKSAPMTLKSIQMDIRVGGQYALEFSNEAVPSMTFYGTYTEVVPPSRLVWTNEEGGEVSITTVTFEDQGGQTLLTLRETHPSEDALMDSLNGAALGLPEQFDQLDAMLADRT